MLELVVSVCLLEDNYRCKDVSLTYKADSVTPKQSMKKSPDQNAKSTESHPKWFAKKWGCRPAGRFAKI